MTLPEALALRFGDFEAADFEAHSKDLKKPHLTSLASRASCRRFSAGPVDPALIRSLCALALCAPSKSDLQQRDIIVIEEPELRAKIDALLAVSAMEWVEQAPVLLVFCGNNRRQRMIHQWRGRPFVNDHLDAFFNAAVDAGIALAAFLHAAESIGLGCCPLSTIRNAIAEVSELLALPDHVFPVAGLAVGWPADKGEISLRLPLALTIHRDRYAETGLRKGIEAYDRRRAAHQPYAAQRFTVEYGETDGYGWSEDKARQYSKPERTGFGGYVRAKGFDLR